MCKFISVEDIVANALIEIYENNGGRKVSFEQLRNYGEGVIRYIKNEKREDAVLLVSRYHMRELVRSYSEFFNLDDTGDSGTYLELRSDKTAEDLRTNFRAYISIDMLLAFTNKNNLHELGVFVKG